MPHSLQEGDVNGYTTNYTDRKYIELNAGNQSVEMRGEILKRQANLLTLQQELYETKQSLPQRFASDLAFPQLTD